MTHPLPELSGPAQRALRMRRITCVDDLESWTWADLAALNGMGPHAIATLRQAVNDARIILREK